jgi:putative endonuclease
MKKKDELGIRGEELAVSLLLSKGYKILCRNHRVGRGELDIICMDSEELVFVEVKTRQTGYFGEPYLSVTKKKQRQIVNLADLYIKRNGLDCSARFDVISVVMNSIERTVNHIQNAFVPGV